VYDTDPPPVNVCASRMTSPSASTAIPYAVVRYSVPGLTPNVSLRYPLYTEPVDGAQQIKNLADDINAALLATQTSIGAITARKSAVVLATTNQANPNTVATIMTYVSEILDNDNMANLGVNNDRLTVQTNGLYLVQTTVLMPAAANGKRRLELLKNGTVMASQQRENAGAGAEVRLNLCMLVAGVATDFFQARSSQDSGGALNTTYRALAATRVSG